MRDERGCTCVDKNLPFIAKQVAATALALRGRLLIAAFFFVAALSHKQMLLFYSPAFFAYMLGLALRRPTWPGKVGRQAHRVRVVRRVLQLPRMCPDGVR